MYALGFELDEQTFDELFKEVDSRGDGTVTRDELITALGMVGPCPRNSSLMYIGGPPPFFCPFLSVNEALESLNVLPPLHDVFFVFHAGSLDDLPPA